jgi:hypothetical protein
MSELPEKMKDGMSGGWGKGYEIINEMLARIHTKQVAK